MRDKLIEFVGKEIKEDIESLLEVPKVKGQGDFALPVFFLAKELKKAPPVIAKEFEEKLNSKLPSFLSKVVAVGPYLNFYLNSDLIVSKIVEGVKDKSLLKVKVSKSEKVLIEYPSPNTNKALHIGHVRNILIGNSLSKILTKVGHKVVRTNLNNDRGIALCKSMLGYEMFFSNETPKSLGVNSDEFVSMCYVKFEEEASKDEGLNNDAQEMLVKWEEGDKNVRALWNKILDMVYSGYKETYSKFKLEGFNKEYCESEIFDKGKELVLDALKNNIKGFGKEDDGAIYCDFENKTLGKKYLLRGDGTTLYMTQDLYLASIKEKEFKADKYVFIVGKEQEYHFQVLFELLERMKITKSSNNYHFAYGYVYDKDGKKFSSRKGKVIGANWLVDETFERAKSNLLSKELTKDLDKKELDRRSQVIGYGALAFSFLKSNPVDDIKFDIDKALAFEGESGPYVQYTYARIQSIFRKTNFKGVKSIDYSLFEEDEVSLIKLLGEYNGIVLEAANKYKISAIANYLLKVSQSFNEFYQNKNIMKSENNIMQARLVLCECVAIVIKDGLELLGIDVLDEM